MKKREVYIMVFYVLDAYWDKNPTDELGNICSGMNPFFFDDEESADPAYWSDFCNLANNEEYSVEDGFTIAEQYISTLNCEAASKAINTISLTEWSNGYKEYLTTIT